MLKASVSRNYRFPTLNDLYFLPGGNPNLRNEHGFSYDAGVSFEVGKENAYKLNGGVTGSIPTSTTGLSGCPPPKDSFRPAT